MAPVETKVKASAAGSALATVVCWLLNRYVFPDGMPAEISAAITVIIVSGVTLGAGWLAKHTPRSSAEASPGAAPAVPPDETPEVAPDEGPTGRHALREGL